MSEAYLTIDDSPSPHSDALADFLKSRDIPALFFCRGDSWDKYPQGANYLVEQGFTLGNHADTHTRFSELPLQQAIAEIERVEGLIDAAYRQAGRSRSVKTFRFPHMDRGTGGWIVDYDALPAEYRDFIIHLFADGLNITLDPPSAEQIDKKDALQEYLGHEGFSQPFEAVTFPWFRETEMARAYDCMYTYSTSDWMMLDRHRGKWPYKSTADLIRKMEDDSYLFEEGSRHIILAHDKVEPELLPVVKDLVEAMLARNMRFVPV